MYYKNVNVRNCIVCYNTVNIRNYIVTIYNNTVNVNNSTDTEMLEVAHALKNTHKIIAID